MNFREQFTPLFRLVCLALGDHWHIDSLYACNYRICIKNGLLKKYYLIVRKEKDRILISDGIAGHHYHLSNKCTVSTHRDAKSIARDIRIKILNHTQVKIQKYHEQLQSEQRLKEERNVLRGVVSNVVDVHDHYGAFMGFRTRNSNNRIDGAVYDGRSSGYTVEMKNLSAENMVKLMCFISTL
ncbi:hypothetical protein ACOZB2_03970 [Pantoea endophytica]|uniref:Uncharacterized protein n=1 Tax=Pantoea sp. BJ2 TaxID=3141322 RepID=A0AAU7U436_9GAMM